MEEQCAAEDIKGAFLVVCCDACWDRGEFHKSAKIFDPIVSKFFLKENENVLFDYPRSFFGDMYVHKFKESIEEYEAEMKKFLENKQNLTLKTIKAEGCYLNDFEKLEEFWNDKKYEHPHLMSRNFYSPDFPDVENVFFFLSSHHGKENFFSWHHKSPDTKNLEERFFLNNIQRKFPAFPFKQVQEKEFNRLNWLEELKTITPSPQLPSNPMRNPIPHEEFIDRKEMKKSIISAVNTSMGSSDYMSKQLYSYITCFSGVGSGKTEASIQVPEIIRKKALTSNTLKGHELLQGFFSCDDICNDGNFLRMFTTVEADAEKMLKVIIIFSLLKWTHSGDNYAKFFSSITKQDFQRISNSRILLTWLESKGNSELQEKNKAFFFLIIDEYQKISEVLRDFDIRIVSTFALEFCNNLSIGGMLVLNGTYSKATAKCLPLTDHSADDIAGYLKPLQKENILFLLHKKFPELYFQIADPFTDDGNDRIFSLKLLHKLNNLLFLCSTPKILEFLLEILQNFKEKKENFDLQIILDKLREKAKQILSVEHLQFGTERESFKKIAKEIVFLGVDLNGKESPELLFKFLQMGLLNRRCSSSAPTLCLSSIVLEEILEEIGIKDVRAYSGQELEEFLFKFQKIVLQMHHDKNTQKDFPIALIIPLLKNIKNTYEHNEDHFKIDKFEPWQIKNPMIPEEKTEFEMKMFKEDIKEGKNVVTWLNPIDILSDVNQTIGKFTQDHPIFDRFMKFDSEGQTLHFFFKDITQPQPQQKIGTEFTSPFIWFSEKKEILLQIGNFYKLKGNEKFHVYFIWNNPGLYIDERILNKERKRREKLEEKFEDLFNNHFLFLDEECYTRLSPDIRQILGLKFREYYSNSIGSRNSDVTQVQDRYFWKYAKQENILSFEKKVAQWDQNPKREIFEFQNFAENSKNLQEHFYLPKNFINQEGGCEDDIIKDKMKFSDLVGLKASFIENSADLKRIQGTVSLVERDKDHCVGYVIVTITGDEFETRKFLWNPMKNCGIDDHDFKIIKKQSEK